MSGDHSDTRDYAHETFSFVWASALIWHLSWHGQWCSSLAHGALILVAMGGLLWPQSNALSTVMHGLSAILFLSPTGANHEILVAYTGVAMCASALGVCASPTLRSSIFPVARSCLLVLYFFAIFHKLNRDYLDPGTPLNYAPAAHLHTHTHTRARRRFLCMDGCRKDAASKPGVFSGFAPREFTNMFTCP